METGKLKTLLLEIHMFILWTVPLCLQGQSPEHVVDLLAALNMSQPIKGISKIHSEDPSGTTTAYKLRTKAPHLTLPPEYSHLLVSTRQGSVGVHLVGRQALDTEATLLSFSSPSSPLLRVVSSTRNDSLRLDYRAVGTRGGGGLQVLFFPGGNPFSGARWVRLALGLEPEKVSLFVDCEEAVVVQRKREEERMDLSFELPEDLAVTLASTAGDNDSKFSGYLKTAEISMRAYGRRPWHCPNITDEPPLPHHTHLPRLDSLDDKGQQELQKDQPQRGVALGPPGHPQGVRSASPTAQEEERLSGLEQRLEQMVVMLDMVKAQNADLQARVRYLEGCDCVMRRRCTWEGSQVEEGHRWQTHSNTVCSCSSGQVTCEANIVGCDLDGAQQNVSTVDGCVTCTCRGGQRDCSPVSCPPLLCSQAESIPGECCQRCTGCGVNGRDFPNGAQIPVADRCQTCTCVKGDVVCSPLPCPALPCPDPVYRPGDCCPSCGRCDFESKVYLDGQDVPSRADPCLRCRCSVSNNHDNNNHNTLLNNG